MDSRRCSSALTSLQPSAEHGSAPDWELEREELNSRKSWSLSVSDLKVKDIVAVGILIAIG
jgi:hypothetical protein